LAVAEATSATVSVKGELVCLPRRDGPQTMECVFGLRGTDGRHYGLRNLDPELLATGKIVLGQQVLVTGLLTPEPMEPYDTAGTIEVDAVVQLNRRFKSSREHPAHTVVLT
jgi:hypothetical protein